LNKNIPIFLLLHAIAGSLTFNPSGVVLFWLPFYPELHSGLLTFKPSGLVVVYQTTNWLKGGKITGIQGKRMKIWEEKLQEKGEIKDNLGE
jgi:hypothetical protein